MNICLCFGYFPSSLEETIRLNTKSGLQNAADVLQKKIIDGLCSLNINLTIINAPFVGYFILKYKSPWVKKSYFHQQINGTDIDVQSYGFNTLPYFTHKQRKLTCKRKLRHWLQQHKEKKIVIVYSVNMAFITACTELKEEFDFKLVVIVPDLPQYMNASNKWYSKLHEKIGKVLSRNRTEVYKKIDGFVYLTANMDKQLCNEYRPYVVVEGIAPQVAKSVVKATDRGKYILYSGSLSQKYGIMNLIEAYAHMKHNKNYSLVLCGSGDSVSEIKELSKHYNINYLGSLPNEEILELQRKATLLINPRLDEGEYTKYSFPSKIIEYFASGTPTMMYKLSGIPEDYYKHCFCLISSDPKSIANQIDEVLNLDIEYRQSVGIAAQNFIIENKNPKVQCNKILNLLTYLLLSDDLTS